MNIGFTYDLKDDYLALGYTSEQAAEFDTLQTIEGIGMALKHLGHQLDPIGNVHALIGRLCQGHRWDMVFNICEGLHGTGREAQVPALLEACQIPYVFSDVMVLSLTLHKGMTKRIIRDLGIPTAPFVVADNTRQLEDHGLAFPLFVKPVAEGTGKGIGPHCRIIDQDNLIQVAGQMLREFNQPVLIETFLPGREVTVGIIGTGDQARVIGMMEVVFQDHETSGIYSYENKDRYLEFIKYRPVEPDLYEQCAAVALLSWQGLGCRDGGRVDLRLDHLGVPNFMEVNPLAGLNPVHSDLPILAAMAGITFQQLIGMIMEAAMARVAMNEESVPAK
ncbi:MAG: hypothetical protein R6U64_08665 [Bacteroidales bacterium]